MVAGFHKMLLSWYLINQKFRETVTSGPRRTPVDDKPVKLLEQPVQQLREKRQPPSDLLQAVVEGEIEECEETISSDDEWVISIKQKLEEAGQDHAADSWPKPSMHRVPHYLRDADEKAYVPQVICLGPYHHNKRRLRQMDGYKWRSLHQILKRTNQDVKIYLDSIKALEQRVRACYEGPIHLTSNEFVEMMVLDGCFELELFQGTVKGFKELGYPRDDPILTMPDAMHSIRRDMIMLENQLPIFVLDRLLGLQLGYPDQKGLVAILALNFFDPLMPTDETMTKSDRNRLESSLMDANTFDPLYQGGLHCLDVFRRSLLRTERQPLPRIWIKKWSQANRAVDKRRQQLIHCVKELKEAGVEFRRRKTHRFWDIKFKGGVLWIPRLVIHEGTRSLLLNLIAFEQRHLDCSTVVTSYMIFMDNLINSSEDVRYLYRRGIIKHWLGSDAEVADLFNRLGEVVFDINDSHLSRLYDDVNRYCNNRWNSWRASLKDDYFRNPWAIISLIAAAILLLLTFAQTFYTVYGYYRPHS